MRFLLGLLFVFVFSACRKGEYITTDRNAKLSIPKDSILFDTIFTSLGSTTEIIKILNKNTDAVNISEVKLSGAEASAFSININGERVTHKSNLILNGLDSLNIFVKVTINPTAKTLPFLVQDSIVINTNGNRQVIQLLAYGQNAVFLNSANVTTNTAWTNVIPYIIMNSVTIKNGATLTIQPGSKIYFHKDATMNVEGNLSALGSYLSPILFCSDRLETEYSEEPGQWKGIHFRQTGYGMIQNSLIKNALVGITSDSLSGNLTPKLILTNSVIKNMQVAGYIGYHSELIAFNNLLSNCGNYLIYVAGGGNYNLKQNTFTGYNPQFARKTAALTFSDYLSSKDYNGLRIDLTNNIIWGNLPNELDIQKKTTAVSQNVLQNNLIKTNVATYSGNGNILNSDPLFTAPFTGNFELLSGSPAVMKGYNLSNNLYFSSYLNKDLKNINRVFPSTLGCFEKK